MRAHVIFLSVVGSCVVVLAERSGENRPISNLQLLPQRLPPPPPAFPTTNDNVQVVKWLLRALHRYLYENGADDLAEIEGPNAREPEFITVVVERADEDGRAAEQRGFDDQDDESDEVLPPMLPYVESDPRHDDQRSRDFRYQPRSQKTYKPYQEDQEQRFQDYLQQLLDAEERDNYEDQSSEQNYRVAPKPLNLEELEPGHSMKEHLKQLPADLQERVALQAHLEHDKGCTWCALLRASGVAPSKPPSASPPPPTPLKKLGAAAAVPDPWFSKMSGRKWMVLHEDYPGMMSEMMNLALDHREKRFRAHWRKEAREIN